MNNKNDGSFFIEDKDFLTGFPYFDINHQHDDWNHAYYEVLNDAAGTMKTFTFTIAASQELFVQGDFYDYRMYPNGCKAAYTTGTLKLLSGSTVIQ